MDRDTERALGPYRYSLAGRLLAAREAVMSPIRPVLREADVTEQQWRVLRVLLDDGPTDISGLVVAALLHQPSVSRILLELDARGLIVRHPDPRDGRRTLATISAAGTELVERVATRTLVLLQEYRDRFGAPRLAALLEELSALTAAIASPHSDEPANGSSPHAAKRDTDER